MKCRSFASPFTSPLLELLGPARALVCVGVLSCAAACGGSEPLPEVPSTPMHDDDEEDSAHEIGAMAEIGALPEEETVAAFSNSLGSIQDCFTKGAQRIEFLGGAISFHVVVGRQGNVENIYASQSTLGDRETERCMFGVLRGADWPKPVGGLIGVAQNGFEFDMSGDVRPPVEIDDFDADAVLADLRSEIRGCKHGSSEPFTATVYIDTNGAPISAGIAAPDKTAESASDCLVDVLKGAKFPSPGSWPAKVTFAL